MIEIVSEWKNAKINCVCKIILHLNYQTLSNMLWFYENGSILNATFLGIYKTTDTFDKDERCHTTLKGLSSVCAKLELPSSKNNDKLEIKVLQNLHRMLFSFAPSLDAQNMIIL